MLVSGRTRSNIITFLLVHLNRRKQNTNKSVKPKHICKMLGCIGWHLGNHMGYGKQLCLCVLMAAPFKDWMICSLRIIHCMTSQLSVAVGRGPRPLPDHCCHESLQLTQS